MNHTKMGDRLDVNYRGSLQTPDLLPFSPQLALGSLVLGEGLVSEHLCGARRPCPALSVEGAAGTLPGKGPLPGQPEFISLFLASGAPVGSSVGAVQWCSLPQPYTPSAWPLGQLTATPALGTTSLCPPATGDPQGTVWTRSDLRSPRAVADLCFLPANTGSGRNQQLLRHPGGCKHTFSTEVGPWPVLPQSQDSLQMSPYVLGVNRCHSSVIFFIISIPYSNRCLVSVSGWKHDP